MCSSDSTVCSTADWHESWGLEERDSPEKLRECTFNLVFLGSMPETHGGLCFYGAVAGVTKVGGR